MNKRTKIEITILSVTALIAALCTIYVREHVDARSINSNAELALVNDNITLIKFSMALENGDKKVLTDTLRSIPSSPRNDRFIQAFHNGKLIEVWAIGGNDDSSGVAMSALINFNTQYSTAKQGKALFVFKRKDSQWVLDWYHPG